MVQQKRKKKLKIQVFLVFLLMGAIVVFAYKSIVLYGGQYVVEKNKDDKTEPVPTITVVSNPAVSIPLGNLYSPNAILVQLDYHRVLLEKNSRQKIYPASLTKIMTTIVAIEKLSDLQKNINLSPSMFQELYKADASMAGFKPDEKVRAIDLLYGVMLPSGAECCIGLADHIAGSEQKFVELMNQKALVLGMKDTHFTNSTGLQDDKHYTTVKDLSILLSYALQNKTFRQIFTASRYSTAPTNKHPDGITFQNTMFKNIENPVISDGKILGGKTGYTDEAGLCLASLAQKDGREYILVTAGAKGNHESKQYNIEDAFILYNSLGKK